MIIATPPSGDIVNASASTTTSGIVTVPAGRWFTGSVQLSAVQSGAGTAAPSVTWTATGADFGPASGSTVARIEVGGILGIISSASNTNEVFAYGGDSGGQLNFSASATSSCVVNGILI